MPAVDCQGQGAAHPDIVKRLPFVVRGDQISAVPVALLNGQLTAERSLQLVTSRRRKATELDRCPVAADRADPDRLLVGENAAKAVEIGQSLVVVIGIADACNRLTQLIPSETKRARAHDILLIPAGVAIEDLLLVDKSVGIGECRDKGARRIFEAEND